MLCFLLMKEINYWDFTVLELNYSNAFGSRAFPLPSARSSGSSLDSHLAPIYQARLLICTSPSYHQYFVYRSNKTTWLWSPTVTCSAWIRQLGTLSEYLVPGFLNRQESLKPNDQAVRHYNPVMILLRPRYDPATIPLQSCYDPIMTPIMILLQFCYDPVMLLLRSCYDLVKLPLWTCYNLAMISLRSRYYLVRIPPRSFTILFQPHHNPVNTSSWSCYDLVTIPLRSHLLVRQKVEKRCC